MIHVDFEYVKRICFERCMAHNTTTHCDTFVLVCGGRLVAMMLVLVLLEVLVGQSGAEHAIV
jgi:hypothetical protein